MNLTCFLPFELEGSFIITSSSLPRANEYYIPKPYENVQPPPPDRTQFSQFLKENIPDDMPIAELFYNIEQDHFNDKKDSYLTSLDVSLTPKQRPKTPRERIQFVKNLLSNVLTYDQIDTSSAGRPGVALNTLTPLQKFVLSLSLTHFNNIFRIEGVYTTQETRKALAKRFLLLFLPSFLNPPKIVRVVSPLTFLEGDIDMPKQSLVYMTVNSPKEIMIESKDLLSSYNLIFTSTDKVNDSIIQLTSADIQSKKLIFKYNNQQLSKDTWNQILWPTVGSTRSLAESVVDSCFAYGKADHLCAAAVTCMARVVTSMDQRFLFALFSVLDDNRSHLPEIFNCLLNFYAFHSKHLQLMKFLCFYEMRRNEDVNEIFRQNNNFIRSINIFIKRVGSDYITQTMKEIYLMITKFQPFKLDNPTERDCEVLKDCLKQFWSKMLDTVDKLPPSIRSLCRYLRLASEIYFVDKNMNHRAIYGVLLLRFIFVMLVSPMEFGIEIEDDPIGYAKVTQFTKVLAFSGQFMLTGKPGSPKAVLNPAIEETNDLVKEFYLQLCQPVPADDVPVSQAELMKTTPAFVKFVQEFKNSILAFCKNEMYSHIFVEEFIAEFIPTQQMIGWN